MMQSDYSKFCDMVDRLNNICDYQKEISVRKEKTYFHALRKYQLKDVANGIEHLIETHKGSFPPPVTISEAIKYVRNTGMRIELSDVAKDMIRLSIEQGLKNAKERFLRLCTLFLACGNDAIDDDKVGSVLAFSRDLTDIEFSYMCGKVYDSKEWPTDEYAAKFKETLVRAPRKVVEMLVAGTVFMTNKSKSRKGFSLDDCMAATKRHSDKYYQMECQNV